MEPNVTGLDERPAPAPGTGGRAPRRRRYSPSANYAFLLSLAAAAILAASIALGRSRPADDPTGAYAILRRVVRVGDFFVPLLGVIAVLVAWHGVDQIRRRPRLFGRRRAALAIAIGFGAVVIPLVVSLVEFFFSEEKDFGALFVRAAIPFALVGLLGIHSFLARAFPEIFRARVDPRSRRLKDIQRGLFPHRRGTPFDADSERPPRGNVDDGSPTAG